EGEGDQEEDEEERTHLAVPRKVPEVREPRADARLRTGRARTRAVRLREPGKRQDSVPERQARRGEEGDAHPERRQHSSDHGAQDETQAESRPDQPHPLRPVPRARYVRHVGLGAPDVRPHYPREDPSHEERRNRTRKPEQEIRQARAEQTDQEDRPSTPTIRQPTPPGRERELHYRVHRDQPGDGHGTRPELLRVQRQQRDHDAEAYQVQEDRQEEDRQATSTVVEGFGRPRRSLLERPGIGAAGCGMVGGSQTTCIFRSAASIGALLPGTRAGDAKLRQAPKRDNERFLAPATVLNWHN